MESGVLFNGASDCNNTKGFVLHLLAGKFYLLGQTPQLALQKIKINEKQSLTIKKKNWSPKEGNLSLTRNHWKVELKS